MSYTQKPGFLKKKDIPFGDARWLTVISPEDPDGPELLPEPNAEYRRLEGLGVRFTREPTESMGEKYAILDDTCGNLVQIYEVAG